MNKEEYKKYVKEIVAEDETMQRGSDNEVIYQIDDLKVYGGFDSGIRGVDHNVLLVDGVDWPDVLNFGTVAVPETESYIGDSSNEFFEDLGYKRLPLNDNHIIKDVQEKVDLTKAQDFLEDESLLDYDVPENENGFPIVYVNYFTPSGDENMPNSYDPQSQYMVYLSVYSNEEVDDFDSYNGASPWKVNLFVDGEDQGVIAYGSSWADEFDVGSSLRDISESLTNGTFDPTDDLYSNDEANSFIEGYSENDAEKFFAVYDLQMDDIRTLGTFPTEREALEAGNDQLFDSLVNDDDENFYEKFYDENSVETIAVEIGIGAIEVSKREAALIEEASLKGNSHLYNESYKKIGDSFEKFPLIDTSDRVDCYVAAQNYKKMSERINFKIAKEKDSLVSDQVDFNDKVDSLASGIELTINTLEPDDPDYDGEREFLVKLDSCPNILATAMSFEKKHGSYRDSNDDFKTDDFFYDVMRDDWNHESRNLIMEDSAKEIYSAMRSQEMER